MASAEDILNSLSEPTVGDMQPTNNINTESTDFLNTFSKESDNFFTDPQFWSGAGNLAKTVGKDYWNTGIGTLAGLLDFAPGINMASPSHHLNKLMFRDEQAMEEDPTFKLNEEKLMEGLGSWFEGGFMNKVRGAATMAPQLIKEMGNEIFQPSLVDDRNPYAEKFGKARMYANIIPQMVNAYVTRGSGSPVMGVNKLVNKLSPKVKNAVNQAFPITTNSPKKWSRFGRNMVLQAPTNSMNPYGINFSNPANASEINTGIQDRDPVRFDSYIQNRMDQMNNRD